MTEEMEIRNQEDREGVSEASGVERTVLEDATYEPESVVEAEQDFKQSEAIESAVVEMVESNVTGLDETVVEAEISPAERLPDQPREGLGVVVLKESPITVEESSETTDSTMEQSVRSSEDITEDVIAEAEADTSSERAPVEQMEVESTSSIAETQLETPTTGEIALDQIPVEGDLAEGNVIDPSVVELEGSEEVLLEQISPEPPEGADINEIWIPPEMYAHYGQDGKITIVDADGKPFTSPPVIQKFVDETGIEKFVAYYPGTGEATKFEISTYTAPVEGLFAHFGQGGKITIVDEKGLPIDSPPLLTKVVNEKGVEEFFVGYPGGTKVDLPVYESPLEEGLFYAHVSQQGKITIVDATGKPIDSPPVITKIVDETGVEKFIASYPGTEKSKSMEMPVYSTELKEAYAHVSQNGNITVVDGEGNPIVSPPLISKVLEDGVEKILAWYPGTETSSKMELTPYSESMRGFYAHVGQDGGITVVDVEGQPVSSPPIITKILGDTGVEKFIASYPGAGEGKPVDLPIYTADFKDVYAHVSQGGKITIVDVEGKPIASPPLIKKILEDGVEKILAYYPGSNGTEIEFYKPISASP
jgi:hypothetical protein